ncbi:MAG: hypothetical protein QNJ55_04005 [Xenococcus sp. MO_188.B8]|nr:hypothetical protein [Xenococcus sp. MO_188.B8]
MNSNHPENLQVCSICSVSITEDGQVNFSNGKPGTRARLYARVCQYTEKPGCINREPELIGELTAQDRYETGEDLTIPTLSNSQTTN